MLLNVYVVFFLLKTPTYLPYHLYSGGKQGR